MAVLVRRIGLGLFVLLAVFLIAFGLLYETVPGMLSFHAAAVPETIRSAVLPLYLALMRLIGGASIALGLIALYVTLGPLRRRQPLALPVLAVCIALPIANAAYVAETLAARTGAPTSWHLMGILLAILAVAMLTCGWGTKAAMP